MFGIFLFCLDLELFAKIKKTWFVHACFLKDNFLKEIGTEAVIWDRRILFLKFYVRNRFPRSFQISHLVRIRRFKQEGDTAEAL